MNGSLTIIGLGPGDERYLTGEAEDALAAAEALYGYRAYLDRVPARDGQTRHESDNREEAARAKAALGHAADGAKVAIVSGGDPGVFAMAASVCEEIEAGPEAWRKLDVTIVPGITAMLAVAARAGAPLGHDFCAISLSDNLKPWELVLKRLDAAAEAGFVMALYNPVSQARPWQLGDRAHAARGASSWFDAGHLRPRGRAIRGGRHGDDARRGVRRPGRHGDSGHRRLGRDAGHCARWASAAGLHAARRRHGDGMIEPGDARPRSSRRSGSPAEPGASA